MKELEDLYAYMRRKHEELILMCAVRSKEDEIKEAEERGALRLAKYLVHESEYPCSSVEDLMQLWREARK